jgi:hypothetical protein
MAATVCGGDCGEMMIEVSSAAEALALATFLRRCECIVVVDGCTVDARPPDRSQTPRQARIELEAYLRVWSALNSTANVKLASDEA